MNLNDKHINEIALSLYASGSEYLSKKATDIIENHTSVCAFCDNRLEDEIKNYIAQTVISKKGDFSEPFTEVSEPGYLCPADQILMSQVDNEPTWFRKSGPKMVDFESGYVYRRQNMLTDLKNLVFSNPVSMMIGLAGSGKTCLALNLVHDLINNVEANVFMFSCGLNRDFDLNILLNDIKRVQGVVILEDIHLAVQKFQLLYSMIKNDTARHFLFTTRPISDEQLYSRGIDLYQIPFIKLDQADDVDKIISYCMENFGNQEFDLLNSKDIHKNIRTVIGSNLWLLTYALEGYITSRGKGDPQNWMRDGITHGLYSLKNCNNEYPEAIVALSALYMEEVLTAEFYMVDKLRFERKLLKELTDMGEITRHVTYAGDVLYGLPHSALAKTYWGFGDIYKKRRGLPSYEDFITDYVFSGATNAIEAYIKHHTKRKMEYFNQKEYSDLPAVISKSKDLKVLMRRMQDRADLFMLMSFINDISIADASTGREMWQLLDIGKLAENLNKTTDISTITFCVEKIMRADPRIAEELCTLLNRPNLVWMLKQIDYSEGRKNYLETLTQANKKVGKEVAVLIA